METLLLHPTEAARQLAIAPEVLGDLVERGQIGCTQVATGIVRIPVRALEDFIERRTVGPGVQAQHVVTPADEPAVVLHPEDPMTNTSDTAAQALPKGMCMRTNADGSQSIRVRTQHGGEAFSATVRSDQLHLARLFQAEVKAGRGATAQATIDALMGAHSLDAPPPPSPGGLTAPEDDIADDAPRLECPAGLHRGTTLVEAFDLFLSEARLERALQEEGDIFEIPTLLAYEAVARRQVERYGAIPVGEWVPQQFKSMLLDVNRTQGRESAKKARSALVALARYLEDWGVISNLTALKAVKVPKKPGGAPDQSRPPRALDQAEFQRLLDVAIAREEGTGRHLLAPALAVGGFGGLSPGEMRALTVGDFDPVAGTLSVTKAVKRVTKGKRGEVADPKNGHRVREALPLPTQAVALLEASLQRVGPCAPSEPLLWARRGGVVSEKTLRACIREAGAELLDIDDLRPKDLRTTAATMLIGAGVAAPVVGGLLGHSADQEGRTVLRHYTHPTDEQMRAAQDRISDLDQAA